MKNKELKKIRLDYRIKNKRKYDITTRVTQRKSIIHQRHFKYGEINV